jgi:hypothetical protein
MERLWKSATAVVFGLAVWAASAIVATAQEGDIGGKSPCPTGGTPCGDFHGDCPQCGNVPQPNLAIPPDHWPPPCCASDPCDPLQSCCPNRDEYFIIPPRPRLYIVSEGAAIARFPGRSLDFASLGSIPTGTVSPENVVLSTGDFGHDFSAAGRLIVGHTFNECLQIEGVYFGVSEGENSGAVRDVTPNVHGGVGNLFSPFGAFGSTPALGLDFNNFAQIRYTSLLQGAELNMRRKMPAVPSKLTTSILFGVRYLGMPEDFQYDTISDITRSGAIATNGATNSIHVATTNDMVGPQIGALFEFYSDNRWWVNFEIKGAVLNNRAHQTTVYTNTDTGTTTVFSGSRQEDHTAFAEEISVEAMYRWSPHFSTQIGYRALWMQNLALAPDNLNTNVDILTLGPAQLNHNSTTLFHGPYAGVVLGW